MPTNSTYTDDETIQQLNNEVYCKLAPSTLHGIGVFAIRTIPKDTPINFTTQTNIQLHSFHQLNKLRPEIKKIIQQSHQSSTNFTHPNKNQSYISFMNHAKSPNTTGYTTLRKIKKGEELTEDYTSFGGILNKELIKATK